MPKDCLVENKAGESSFNSIELNLHPMDKDKKPADPTKKEQI